MGVFGLGSGSSSSKKSKSGAKKTAKGGQNKEAKAILKKMAAKKDSGDCAFC